MSELKADQALALQILMNEDLYLIDQVEPVASLATVASSAEGTKEDSAVTELVLDYLGENNKYFAILVNYATHQYMAPKELEALQSILGAKKMDLKDVAIVNLHKYPQASFSAVRQFLVCNRMVLFGISPQSIQLPSMSSNQIVDCNGVKVLTTYAFSEMMADVEKKKTFWNVMKGL